MCLYRVPQKARGILFSNGLKEENKQDKKPGCSCVCVCARTGHKEKLKWEGREEKKRTKSPERYYETAGRRGKRGRMSREETSEDERLHQSHISGHEKKKKRAKSRHCASDTEQVWDKSNKLDNSQTVWYFLFWLAKKSERKAMTLQEWKMEWRQGDGGITLLMTVDAPKNTKTIIATQEKGEGRCK